MFLLKRGHFNQKGEKILKIGLVGSQNSFEIDGKDMMHQLYTLFQLC